MKNYRIVSIVEEGPCVTNDLGVPLPLLNHESSSRRAGKDIYGRNDLTTIGLTRSVSKKHPYLLFRDAPATLIV